MPIRDREDAAEVEAGIARVFGAPPEERAAAIRQLFVEALDFNPAQGQVSLANAPAGVELPDAADRVAWNLPAARETRSPGACRPRRPGALALRGRRAGPALADRHHRAPHAGAEGLLRRRAGRLLTADRGLVHC